MSKIKITELNVTASEFNTLNDQETTEVVGGVGNFFSTQIALLEQTNTASTLQIALGGGAFSSTTNASATEQENAAVIIQQ